MPKRPAPANPLGEPVSHTSHTGFSGSDAPSLGEAQSMSANERLAVSPRLAPPNNAEGPFLTAIGAGSWRSAMLAGADGGE
jgi:hypothetical protein